MPSVFTPPTFQEQMPPSAGRLFSFYSLPRAFAVVFRNGRFQSVRTPSQEETAALVEGVTWFAGGRSYLVSDATATLLTTDGYTTTTNPGYGNGPYGNDFYGG